VRVRCRFAAADVVCLARSLRSFRKRLEKGLKLGLTHKQAATLARLKSPVLIQDFINKMPPNYEPGGDTCLSVVEALRQRRAHCIEGAFIAACALWMNGEPPLLLDFQARKDDDHVVALFKRHGCWGAISKSNHLWLRWREPVYRNLRELAMSYFNEYIGKQKRTLWTYSVPFDLRRFATDEWITAKESCWDIANTLDESRHYRLITEAQAKRLRPCDPIELAANKLTEHRPPSKTRKNKKKRA
jgi:hypothetical protein